MQIPYRTVEVSPLTKKQLKWADYKKVPVAVLDGEAYGDSTAIITRLAAELKAAERSQDTAQHGRSSSSFWPFGSRKKSTNSDMVGSLAHWVFQQQSLCERIPRTVLHCKGSQALMNLGHDGNRQHRPGGGYARIEMATRILHLVHLCAVKTPVSDTLPSAGQHCCV